MPLIRAAWGSCGVFLPRPSISAIPSMANLVVSPLLRLSAELTVPGDKSISHRAVMIGALGRGETRITNFLGSADCLATLACFKNLGIEITWQDAELVVTGKGLKGLQPYDDEL